MRTTLLAAALALAAAAPAAAENVNMQPGLWEGKVEMMMAGMPAPNTRPFTQCLKAEDLGDPVDMLETGQGCTLVESDHTDDVFSYRMQCAEGTMTGRIAFAGDHYDGTGKMVMQAEGRTMEATMTMQGRRVGPCP